MSVPLFKIRIIVLQLGGEYTQKVGPCFVANEDISVRYDKIVVFFVSSRRNDCNEIK
jgi:hypothetical protein